MTAQPGVRFWRGFTAGSSPPCSHSSPRTPFDDDVPGPIRARARVARAQMRGWYDQGVDYVLEDPAMGDKSPKNQKKQLARLAEKAARPATPGAVVAAVPAKPAR